MEKFEAVMKSLKDSLTESLQALDSDGSTVAKAAEVESTDTTTAVETAVEIPVVSVELEAAVAKQAKDFAELKASVETLAESVSQIAKALTSEDDNSLISTIKSLREDVDVQNQALSDTLDTVNGLVEGTAVRKSSSAIEDAQGSNEKPLFDSLFKSLAANKAVVLR